MPLAAVYWPTYRWTASAAGASAGAWGAARGRAADHAVTAWARGRLTDGSAARRDLQLVLRTLRALRLTLLSTQEYTGGDLLATRADILARREDGGHVLIEQKVGFRGGAWTRGSGFMRHELRAWSDCPRNQALVQLAVTVALWEKHRGRVRAAYVVHIGESGAQAHALPESLRRLAQAILARLQLTIRSRRQGTTV